MRIKTREEYDKALAECEALVASDPRLDTPDGDRLVQLSSLVVAYEHREFPLRARARKFREWLELVLLLAGGVLVALLVYAFAAGVMSP